MNKPVSQQIYRPISCDFYDELEALATRGESCHLHYLAADGKMICIQSKLLDFQTVDKEEFLLIAEGIKIRLDRIRMVNHISPSDSKFC